MLSNPYLSKYLAQTHSYRHTESQEWFSGDTMIAWRKCYFNSLSYQRMVAKYKNGRLEANRLFFHVLVRNRVKIT